MDLQRGHEDTGCQAVENALSIEMNKLERLWVIIVPCELPYAARIIKTRVILKNNRSTTAGRRG